MMPERSMWCAVIMQAVADYITFKGAMDVNSRRLFYSAERWLFDDLSGRFNSLEALCEQLDFEPAFLRTAIKQMTSEELRQLKLRQSRRNYGPSSQQRRRLRSPAVGGALQGPDESRSLRNEEDRDPLPGLVEFLSPWTATSS